MRVGPQKGPNVRKKPVKVYLSREELELLDRVCREVGKDRSTYIAAVIQERLHQLNLVRERLHGGQKVPDRP